MKGIIWRSRDGDERSVLSPGSEYEVKSNDTLIIPFGSLQNLTIINEHEKKENLISKTNSYDFREEEYEKENEAIFFNACLENLETEKIGRKKDRTIYNFEFKRLSLEYPSFIKKTLTRWKPYEALEVGQIEDIDERFLDFLPEIPPEIKQELKQITGNVSIENPMELAFKIYEWTRKNFKHQRWTAEHLKELLEERNKDGVFSGDCLEYGRVFSNIMRTYNVPTTLISGKLGYGFGGHCWSEVCIPVKTNENYKTMFLPVDTGNNKFGNINERYLYFSHIPSLKRKRFWGKETILKNLKLIYS